MRHSLQALAGLVLISTVGAARAEDWRAVSTSHHDVVFVDADSVRRQSDGRIAFRARHRLNENESNRDFGYDRIDLAVAGRCAGPSADPAPASSVRKYYLHGKAVSAPDWREEDLAEDVPELAEDVCRGFIGYRRWADLDLAMADYAEKDSLERLAAFVSGETEMVGTVVQGWEMNGVSLCGEDACRERPPTDFCWLEGSIYVPTPAEAPEWVNGGPRRDSAGAAFTGRVYRSRDGKGFGHMSGFGCLVETIGPARFVAIPEHKANAPDTDAGGRSAEAVAAHRALAETVKSSGSISLAVGRRRWEADDFSPSTSGGGACLSFTSRKGVSDFNAPALGWGSVDRIERQGPAITLIVRYFDSDLHFYFPDPQAGRDIEAFLRRLQGRGVASIAQTGRTAAIRFEDKRKETFLFADPATAVQAAGFAHRLHGHDIAELKREGNQLTAVPLQRISLAFPDEAKAAEAEERALALRAACRV